MPSKKHRLRVVIDTRVHYGVDGSYLVINEYPLEYYFQILEFVCYNKNRQSRGILEVSCLGSD